MKLVMGVCIGSQQQFRTESKYKEHLTEYLKSRTGFHNKVCSIFHNGFYFYGWDYQL